MDRTEASDAFDAGSIPVGCIFFFYGDMEGEEGSTGKEGTASHAESGY